VTALWRVAVAGDVRLAAGDVDAPRALLPAGVSVAEALARWPDEVDVASDLPDGARVLAPVDEQEVWASGVTFERSRSARNEEAGPVDYYDNVYDADRPELFFKSTAWRVAGPDAPIGVRSDSGWDVPEPEIGLVADSSGRLVAYTVANDVSSRSIEGANPLYLPQAKVYRGSCALGPCLVPVADAPAFADMEIRLLIERGGAELFHDGVPLTAMRRRPEELLDWLFRAMDFPAGVVLLTGTSVVPPPELTLLPGDVVTIEVPGLGTLVNPVVLVDAGRPPAATH